jgi:hypothetical protein
VPELGATWVARTSSFGSWASWSGPSPADGHSLEMSIRVLLVAPVVPPVATNEASPGPADAGMVTAVAGTAPLGPAVTVSMVVPSSEMATCSPAPKPVAATCNGSPGATKKPAVVMKWGALCR